MVRRTVFAALCGVLFACGSSDPDRGDDQQQITSDNDPTTDDETDNDNGDGDQGLITVETTVYAVKDGTIAAGTSVKLTSLLVTATAEENAYAQIASSDPAYAGADNSGILIDHPSPRPAVGDRIDVNSGIVTERDGAIVLLFPVVTILSSGNAPPAPARDGLSAANLEDGAKAEALEGVLVQLEDVRVSSAGADDFELDDGVLVSDLLYRVEPFPIVGERYDTITGVLTRRDDAYKIVPRNAADVALSPIPALVAFGPASFIRVGATTTIPQALRVRLSRSVIEDTLVSLTSSDTTALTVSDVTIPAGSAEAVVVLEALAQASGVMLSATFGADVLETTVRVLGDSEQATLSSLTPASQNIAPGGSAQLTVTTDIPVASQTLVAIDGQGGVLPAVVTIPADSQSTTFTFVATNDGGVRTISASLNGQSATATVTVVATPPIIINEVDYDTPDEASDFVELYNTTDGDLTLDGLALVLVNGTNSAEYERLALTGTLASHGYYVIELGTSEQLPNGMQSGAPDGVALIDVVASSVRDALSYEGSIAAASIVGFSEPVSLVEGYATLAVDTDAVSLARCPDGFDTDNALLDWQASTMPTPGALNACPE